MDRGNPHNSDYAPQSGQNEDDRLVKPGPGSCPSPQSREAVLGAILSDWGQKGQVHPPGTARTTSVLRIQHAAAQFIGPERFTRKAGDLMILGPGIPHYGMAKSLPQRAITVFFLPTLLFELGPEADGRRVLSRFTSSTPASHRLIRPPATMARNMASYFEGMLVEFEKPKLGSELRFRALLGMALTELLRWEAKQRPLPQVTTGVYDWALIERVLNFMQLHYKEQIYVQDIAKFAGLSQGRLQSTFRRAMGMSCMQYLRSYRITHACALLCLPGARVTEVAMEVGFETLSHFNLSFRKFCECSPSEYIRRRGRTLRTS
ncbi:MAG: AraC family transcriptional regulator [Betaproteobacteria bacterium]|nr:AraC family transcriptional regulator [Betaproteobacteria bacterium]